MKIQGPLVDMLLKIAPEVYNNYWTYEGQTKVLYIMMLKAIYGMLQSSLLYYKKFWKDIESIGFKVNPYDPCVTNCIVNGKQHTISWHVDDLKSSHLDSKVNDQFLEWLEKTYASDDIGHVKAVHGKCHDYLAMILNFSIPDVLQVNMTPYVKSMIEEFPDKLSGKTMTPWNENLFKVDLTSKPLDPERAKQFHTFVMKGMFLCKCGHQGIQLAIAFMATRVTEPNEADWKKLVKMMNYLKVMKDDVPMYECWWYRWHVNAAFTIHKDMKSHTGATMSLGSGTICSISTKQKVNTQSFTEAELIWFDDVVSKILWSKLFIEGQGFQVKANIVYWDNTSSMHLEENGKASSGKHTHHFHIKYFYITNLINRNQITIEYCPTEDMIADYMTKPLVGTKFEPSRSVLENEF